MHTHTGGEEFAHVGVGDDGVDVYAKKSERLGLFATIGLSAEFSILWWLANYCFCVCYIYTSATRGSAWSSTSSESLILLCVALLCCEEEVTNSSIQVYGLSFSVLCFVLRDLVGQRSLQS